MAKPVVRRVPAKRSTPLQVVSTIFGDQLIAAKIKRQVARAANLPRTYLKDKS